MTLVEKRKTIIDQYNTDDVSLRTLKAIKLCLDTKASHLMKQSSLHFDNERQFICVGTVATVKLIE